MIELNCSECGKRLKVQDEAAGKRGKCPQCGATLLVPQEEFVTFEEVDPPISPQATPHAQATSPSNRIKKKRQSDPPRKHRRWMILLVLVALVVAPLAPRFTLWLGIVFLALCVFAFVPKVGKLSRQLLRLPSDQKLKMGMRVTMYFLVGFALVYIGWGATEFKAEQERIVAVEAAEEAERQRLITKANQAVRDLTSEASDLWASGNASLAEDKLEQAEQTANATNFKPVQRLRTRMADAEVESLVAEADQAIQDGDLALAAQKAREALETPYASALEQPRELERQIANATNPERVKDTLLDLSDEEFRTFVESNLLPDELTSGYETIDSHTLKLAKASMSEVTTEREERRREELARAKAEEEAARKAQKEREIAARKAQEERESRTIPLVVESWSWHFEHGFAIAEGEVTNRSPKRLDNVQAVVSFYTEDGTFITTGDALVEYNPILSGQTTPFKIIARKNPQMKSARLAFKSIFGGSINHAKR